MRTIVSFISFNIAQHTQIMETLTKITKPSKDEQTLALESYSALASAIEQLKSDVPEIEIEETKEKIQIPISALKLLGDILKQMSKGAPFSLIPVAAEVTTQKAAEIIGCSRPHIVKLLEQGAINFTKVGKHRRVKIEDAISYRDSLKKNQKSILIDIMKSDEELGLYDS